MGHLREFANSLLGCIRRIVASRLIEVNPFVSTGEAIPEVLDSVLVSPVWEKHGHTGTSSVLVHRGGPGTGISYVRKSERAGTTECGEGKAQRGLICVYKSWL